MSAEKEMTMMMTINAYIPTRTGNTKKGYCVGVVARAGIQLSIYSLLFFASLVSAVTSVVVEGVVCLFFVFASVLLLPRYFFHTPELLEPVLRPRTALYFGDELM